MIVSVAFKISGKACILKLNLKIHKPFKKVNSLLSRFFICLFTACCMFADIGIGIEGLDRFVESLHDSFRLSFSKSPDIINSFKASLINKGLPDVFKHIFFNNTSGIFYIFIVFRIKASVSSSDRPWRFIFFIDDSFDSVLMSFFA